ERLRQDLVQRLAVGDALLELRGLGLQLIVGELLHLRLQGVDPGDDTVQLAQEPFVTAAEDTGEQFVDHRKGQLGMNAAGAGGAVAPERCPGRRHLFIVAWDAVGRTQAPVRRAVAPAAPTRGPAAWGRALRGRARLRRGCGAPPGRGCWRPGTCAGWPPGRFPTPRSARGRRSGGRWNRPWPLPGRRAPGR